MTAIALGYIGKARLGWDESKHPRGQPGNAGEFGPGGGGGKKDAPKKEPSKESPAKVSTVAEARKNASESKRFDSSGKNSTDGKAWSESLTPEQAKAANNWVMSDWAEMRAIDAGDDASLERERLLPKKGQEQSPRILESYAKHSEFRSALETAPIHILATSFEEP